MASVDHNLFADQEDAPFIQGSKLFVESFSCVCFLQSIVRYIFYMLLLVLIDGIYHAFLFSKMVINCLRFGCDCIHHCR